MATGPEHYALGELELDTALTSPRGSSWEQLHLASAQVHATLALAAATAMATYSDGEMDARDYYAWHAVAGVKGEYDGAETKYVAGMTTSLDLIGAMARHTSTHGTTAANAEEYRVGDLVNVSQPKHPHWGTRGKVVGFTDDVPALVAVEYDNLGNCLYLAPSQLMHHGDFVKQDQEYFDAAETADVRQIERELDVWAGDDSEALQQEAEDDARAERRSMAAHDARTCPGCPLCTGYPDSSEPDNADEDYDEPMTNRNIDPDAHADPYLDKLGYNESEGAL